MSLSPIHIQGKGPSMPLSSSPWPCPSLALEQEESTQLSLSSLHTKGKGPHLYAMPSIPPKHTEKVHPCPSHPSPLPNTKKRPKHAPPSLPNTEGKSCPLPPPSHKERVSPWPALPLIHKHFWQPMSISPSHIQGKPLFLPNKWKKSNQCPVST